MPTIDPVVLRTMRRLDRLESHVRTLQATPRLRNSSVEGGSLLVRDDAGNTRVIIGQQSDGSTTVQDVGGTPPPRPSAPVIVPGPDGVSITWDGHDDAGNLEPWDAALSHISVRITPTSGSLGTEVARMTASPSIAYGGAVYLAQDPSLTTYVTLVAVRRSGVESAPSAEAEATSVPYVAPVDLDPLNAALDDLQTALDAAQASLATLNDTTLPGLESDLADLDTRVDASDAAVANLNDTVIPGLDSALAGLDGRLDTAESDIDAAQASIGTNAAAITAAQTAIDAAQASLDTLNTSTLPSMQGDLDATSDSLANLYSKFPITAPDIAAGAVTTNKLDALAVTAAKIAANTITAAQIAAHTITASEIAADTITANEIAASAITTLELAANAVTAAKIAAHTITANEIAADTITANEIAANAITTLELAANAVTAAKIAANTITAAQIAADTITANEIAANAITTTELAANAVTAAKIAANTITAAQIAAHTITATQIAADTITANEIATDTITANEIAARTITASEIATATITANELAAGSITADKMVTGSIEAGKVVIGIATWTPAEGLIVPGSLLVPSPTAQVITISGNPTGGTFTLTGNNTSTSGIAFNASAATVQTAIRGLGGAFAGAVVSGSAGGPYTVNVGPIFSNQRLSVTTALTGGTSPSAAITYIVASPTFTGGVTATSLTVQKDFNLLGTTNQIAGTLTLANGIVAPTVAPTAFQSWQSVGAHDMPFGAVDYGLAPHLSDGNILLTAVAFFGGGISAIQKSNGQYGVGLASGNSGDPQYKPWCVSFNPQGGITTLGSNYYVLGHDDAASRGAAQGAWYIYKLDSSFNKVSEVLVAFPGAYSWGTRPSLGNDGTNLLVAYMDSGNVNINISRFDPSTMAFTTAVSYNVFPGGAGYPVSHISLANYDFGASRWIVALEGHYLNFVLDGSTGSRNSDANAFPVAAGHSVRGLWWDGARFWSYGTNGTLYKHGTNIAPESDAITYTWYDGDTSSGSTEHETAESPVTTFSRPARTFLNIQTQEAPDSGVTDATRRDKANRVGIYVGVNGGTRRLQAYNGIDADSRTIRSLTLDAVNTGSAAWGAKATFSGVSGSAGLIQSFAFVSGTSGFQFQGDGSAKLGPVALSAAGVMSGPGFDYWFAEGGVGTPQQNITSTTGVDLTNLTVTVPVVAGAVYEVHAHVDMAPAASTISVVELMVDGTAQNTQMLNVSGTVASRLTIDGHWVVSGVAAGNRVFKLRGRVGSSNCVMGGQHCNLIVRRIK